MKNDLSEQFKISQINGGMGGSTSSPTGASGKVDDKPINGGLGGGIDSDSLEVTIPKVDDPFGGKTLSEIVNQGITILLTLIIIAAVIVIIVAGFRMIAGGGNPDQISKAKKTIIWAIIGIVVAFMSFGIVQIIQTAI